MKIFVHTLITMAALTLGNVGLADAKALVITGRVVQLSEQNITVQSGKERLEIGIVDAGSFDAIQGAAAVPTKYIGRPKVGDTVTVYYRKGTARFDPDGFAIKIEVKAAVGSKK